MKSRGMQALESIFWEYEREIAELRQENARLRKDLDDWIGLTMKGQAVHDRAMVETIIALSEMAKAEKADG